MTTEPTYRKTAILVASLWVILAVASIAGNALMNPVITAPDYLSTVFPKSATVVSGALLWLVNNIGVVFIGVLMFPILKKRNESMALGYVGMRILECVFMTVGVFFAMLFIPLSQAFIKSGATNAATYQAVGSMLKQAETWLLLGPGQLLPLGLGGVILTSILYQTKLVPRFISVVGIVGYSLLLPAAILALFGVLDPTVGGSASIYAVPVAVFEIILMPVWLFAKGFNTAAISAEQEPCSEKMELQPC